MLEGNEPNYSEVSFKMDKFMPDDPDLMHEYHQMMDDEDREGLINFFIDNADGETMKHYGGPNFTIEGFVDWLIAND